MGLEAAVLRRLRSADAVRLLKPKVAVPTHYLRSDPRELFEQDLPQETNIRILGLGKALNWKAESGAKPCQVPR